MTTIVFDVGNVLLDWDARLVLKDVLPDTEIDAVMEEIGFTAWNLEQDLGRSWDEAVAVATEAHPHQSDIIRRFHEDWHKSVPGAIDGSVEILRTLAATQPVYAITNFSSEKWRECVDRFDFLRLFTDTVVSGDERLIKPDPRIYETLLERNGLTAEACLFIDDSEKNVVGAQQIGMRAVRFSNPKALARDLGAHGVQV